MYKAGKFIAVRDMWACPASRKAGTNWKVEAMDNDHNAVELVTNVTEDHAKRIAFRLNNVLRNSHE
jgi:hypothetical protein